jgi:hypothetical protein
MALFFRAFEHQKCFGKQNKTKKFLFSFGKTRKKQNHTIFYKKIFKAIFFREFSLLVSVSLFNRQFVQKHRTMGDRDRHIAGRTRGKRAKLRVELQDAIPKLASSRSMLIEVFRFIPFMEQRDTLTQVSKQFNDFSNHASLWQNIDVEFKRCKSTDEAIQKIRCQRLFEMLDKAGRRGLTTLSLRIHSNSCPCHWPFGWSSWLVEKPKCNFPELTTLTIHNRIERDSVITICKASPKLRVFHTYTLFDPPKELDHVKFIDRHGQFGKRCEFCSYWGYVQLCVRCQKDTRMLFDACCEKERATSTNNGQYDYIRLFTRQCQGCGYKVFCVDCTATAMDLQKFMKRCHVCLLFSCSSCRTSQACKCSYCERYACKTCTYWHADCCETVSCKHCRSKHQEQCRLRPL